MLCSNCSEDIRRLSLELEKRTNANVPHPIFGRNHPKFYGNLLPRFTHRRLAKFGWVPFADLRLRSLAM